MDIVFKRKYKDDRRPALADRSACILLGYDVMVDGEKVGGVLALPHERKFKFVPIAGGGPPIEERRLKELKRAIAGCLNIRSFTFGVGDLVHVRETGARLFVAHRERVGGRARYWLVAEPFAGRRRATQRGEDDLELVREATAPG